MPKSKTAPWSQKDSHNPSQLISPNSESKLVCWSRTSCRWQRWRWLSALPACRAFDMRVVVPTVKVRIWPMLMYQPDIVFFLDSWMRHFFADSKNSSVWWISRWAAHMSTAAMRSFACSLLHLPASTTNNINGPEPFLGDILTLHPHSHPPTSLLPPPPPLMPCWFCTSGDWPI